MRHHFVEGKVASDQKILFCKLFYYHAASGIYCILVIFFYYLRGNQTLSISFSTHVKARDIVYYNLDSFTTHIISCSLAFFIICNSLAFFIICKRCLFIVSFHESFCSAFLHELSVDDQTQVCFYSFLIIMIDL